MFGLEQSGRRVVKRLQTVANDFEQGEQFHRFSISPLQLMQAKLRTMRIYDGPTEVHKWVVARNMLGTRR